MDSFSEGAQGRGFYMWLLFVRNGACGGGREEKRGKSEVCRGDAVPLAHIHMCECVNVCLFEEEKEG